MAKFKLSKPIDIDGKRLEELEYDLDEVTGADIENACKSIDKIGYVILAQETDPVLHAHIFAAAAGIAYEDMKRMNAKDFTRATAMVRDFFIE